MVELDREKQRARYIAGSDGAPPVPPPGGYRGARRTPGSIQLAAAATLPDSRPVPEPRPPASAFSIVVLIASVLFAVLLLIMLIGGATDALYGVTLVTCQLVVLAASIAAVLSRRGRVLGAVSLSIVLLLNVASVGALSALRTSANGSYSGVQTQEQKHQEGYPGIKDLDPSRALDQLSLEEFGAQADDLLAALREKLSGTLDVTWVDAVPTATRFERNGYGGESLLQQYTSTVWTTNEPVQDYDDKMRALDAINEVVNDFTMSELYSFNDPAVSGENSDILTKFYGSTDPLTQHTWEAYSYDWENDLILYVNVYDLSQDPSGDFRAEREAQNARTGEPLEGIRIYVLGEELLSDADRAEFEKQLTEYEDLY